VLNKIFGPRNDDVSEQFRILYNDELCDVYRSYGIDCEDREVKEGKWEILLKSRHIEG
jgi:hypothetical protein